MDAALTPPGTRPAPVPPASRFPRPVTLVCALEVEAKAARKGVAPVACIGLGARLPLPGGPLVGFGLGGALVEGLRPGALVSARRIVDEWGAVLWEGEPFPMLDAEPAVICAAGRVVDGTRERRALAERTGAAAVDMESAALARTGRLVGVVRAVSDTPARPVGRLAGASTEDGLVDWSVVARSFLGEPLTAARSALAARRALSALSRAAAALDAVAEGAR